MAQRLRTSNKYNSFVFHRSYDYETKSKFDNVANKSQDDWKKIVIDELSQLVQTSQINYLIYIFHDKDTINGQLKPLHLHGVINFKSGTSPNSARKKLSPYNDRSQNCEFATNESHAIKYLIHATENAQNEMKYPYDIENLTIFKNDKSMITDIEDKKLFYSQRIAADKSKQFPKSKSAQSLLNDEIENFKLDILTDTRTGLYSSFSDTYFKFIEHFEKFILDNIPNTDEKHANKLANQLYSKHFTAKFKSEFKLSLEHYFEMQSHQKKFPMALMFTSFKGGSGKSSFIDEFANWIYQKNGWTGQHFKGATGADTRAMLDKYNGETICVFDEVNLNIPQQVFCDSFDNINKKNIHTRYRNTTLLSKFAFFSTSDTFEKFSSAIGTNSIDPTADKNDKIFQIQRRFQIILQEKPNSTEPIAQIFVPDLENRSNKPVLIAEMPWPSIDELKQYSISGTDTNNKITNLFEYIYPYLERTAFPFADNK